MLYVDGAGKLKRGKGVKDAGGSRRLVKVFMQFDRTFDLHTIAPNELFSMLPREFDRFKAEVHVGKRPALVRG